jgi:hypothetical protein
MTTETLLSHLRAKQYVQQQSHYRDQLAAATPEHRMSALASLDHKEES